MEGDNEGVGEKGTIWMSTVSRCGISRPPLGRVHPIPNTCCRSLELSHDDKSGLSALPSNQSLSLAGH